MKHNNIKSSCTLIAIIVIFATWLPINLNASNTGPNAPEVAGFEPFDATDMVNLGSGDLAYTMPLMEVGGFPITMAYHAGVPTTLDASWVGLGWYLNTGAINRQQVAVPDDWLRGTAINFISFKNSETNYNIGVGFSAGPAGSIGVGYSWGSNKSLSGSIQYTVGMKDAFGSGVGVGITGSLDQDGGYYIGAYAKIAPGGGSDNVTASIGYSSSGDWTFGAKASDGFSSIGVNYNTKGIWSINASSGDNSVENGVSGGGGSFSFGSFTQGDYDVSVDKKGLNLDFAYVGVPFYIRFSRSKVTYSLKKGYKDIAFGVMYSSAAKFLNPSFNRPDGNTDFKNRSVYMDVYEQALPQDESEYISDFRPNEEKLNFTYAGYDNFEVQANGINGRLKARLFDNVTLYNRGFNAKSSTSSGKKNHVFYHKSGVDASRIFGQSNNHNMQMYFEGAFSSKEIIEPSDYDLIGTRLDDLVNDPPPGENSFTNNPNNRPTSSSYVEVFENESLINTKGIVMEPEELPFNLRLNRNYVDPKGIGAYKITSPDGKTYHFTIPVYQFEIVKRSLLKEPPDDIWNAKDVSENRQYNRYATHWLLTAVTGPDFVDVNNDGKVGEEDYGYWLRLEYGKWSDGYTWKQPYDDDARLYTTNQVSKINNGDFGYFSFGRKQMYYLNKIVSKERTALFVKDIRHDAVGRGFEFKFPNTNSGGTTIGITGENNGFLNEYDSDLHVRETGVTYKKEYSLKLNRIVLIKNNVAELINPTLGNGLGSGLSGYVKNETVNGTWDSPDFQEAYSSNYEYQIHQEDNVLDIKDFQASGIQPNVLREIRFAHSYDLAKRSSNSITTSQNPNKGKLTLDSLYFLGKGGYGYMPPYVFQYHDEDKDNISYESIREEVMNEQNPPSDNTNYYRSQYVIRKNQKIDNWGYINDDEDRWSLKSIKMPTGAEIKITYEEDKYWIEAFSRRIFNHGLKFRWETISGSQNKRLRIQKSDWPSISEDAPDDFTKYIDPDLPLYVDFWFYFDYTGVFEWLFGGDPRASVKTEKLKADVSSVTPDELVLILPPDNNQNVDSDYYDKLHDFVEWIDEGMGIVNFGKYYPPNGRCNFSAKIIANKIPENEIGGGLRVAKIETFSSDGNTGMMQYNYNFPNGHDKAGRSSGITSFAPLDGLQFIPYQTELPTPGVQYEYVTIYRKGNNQTLDYTRYNFHVLKPVFNIFEPEFELENNDPSETPNPYENDLFWAKVEEGGNAFTTAKKIHVHVNTAILGQLKQIEQFNSVGQLISKVTYDYINGDSLNVAGKGLVQESFNSAKTIYETNEAGNSLAGKGRFISISTRTDYSNMLKKVTNHANGLTMSVEYDDVDPVLGSFRKSITTRADGTEKIDYRVPAYEVYPDMAPKAWKPENKNMLTQSVMNITNVKTNNQENTTNASVTTWRNSSYYDNSNTITNDSIWRKHEAFVWKDDLDANGTFGVKIDQNDFNWTNTQNNPKWQKISETTRYNHWSAPLEVKDVNNNFASSKMGDNNTKVFASGNAGFNEMFYSGAEDLNVNTFGGNVARGTAVISGFAHTGKYSLSVSSGQKAYVVSVSEGKSNQYKASMWVKYGNHESAKLRVAGNTVNVRENETVRAGDWVQMNFYFTISGTQTVEVFTAGGPITVDDFRLHPVTTSMNSYVYNEWDELTYILGANNMATRYEYDEAGRLKSNYAEVADFKDPGSGGFKVTNEHKYNYQNTTN